MELIQRTSWLALQITCTRTHTRKHTRGTTPDIVSSTTSSEVQLPSRPSCKRYSVLFSKKETNFRNQLAILYQTFRYFNFFLLFFLFPLIPRYSRSPFPARLSHANFIVLWLTRYAQCFDFRVQPVTTESATS